MLNNPSFYHRSVYNLIVAFGSLFYETHIVRRHPTDNSKNQTLRVPIRYGPRQKWLAELEQDPDKGTPGKERQVQITLPLMTYQITSYTYDGSRKLPNIGRHANIITNENNVLRAQFNPVPIDVGIELAIMTKSLEDGLMIVEQIVPFFVPDYTLTINDIPDMAIKKDVPVVLNGFSNENNTESTWTDSQVIQWTMNFTAKMYMYPPIKQVKVTTEAQIRMRIEEEIFRIDTTTPLPDDADATTVEDGQVTSDNNT